MRNLATISAVVLMVAGFGPAMAAGSKSGLVSEELINAVIEFDKALGSPGTNELYSVTPIDKAVELSAPKYVKNFSGWASPPPCMAAQEDFREAYYKKFGYPKDIIGMVATSFVNSYQPPLTVKDLNQITEYLKNNKRENINHDEFMSAMIIKGKKYSQVDYNGNKVRANENSLNSMYDMFTAGGYTEHKNLSDALSDAYSTVPDNLRNKATKRINKQGNVLINEALAKHCNLDGSDKLAKVAE